jgi:hypothetical protein
VKRSARYGRILVCLSVTMVGSAGLQNPSFTQGLTGWKAAWHVAAAGEAVLTDTQDRHAFLFQTAALTDTVFTVRFDFRGGLSSTVPAGAFRDSFFASLYFVSQPHEFILEHDSAARAEGLLDLDATGPYNVHGTISASPRGDGWSRFTGTFTNGHAYAVVAFELHDLNAVPGDSTIRVDDVDLLPATPP